MQRKIIRVGNSQGVVIPKAILKLLGWEGVYYIDLEINEGRVILTTPGQAIQQKTP